MSRAVVITITAEVEDSVTDEQLDYVAAAAMIQVIEPVLGDSRALDLIARILSGLEWSPDTIDLVADYVRQTGRTVSDVTE